MNRQKSEKTGTPTVSVIIPAFMTTPFIAKALDSVLAQTFRDFEIIVVNDGSPDTPDLERVLQPYMKDIVYVKQPNGGLAHARNTGIRNSRAPLIALLDSDDYWEPDYLATHVRILLEDQTADAVYPNAVLFGIRENSGKVYMDVFPSVGEVTFISLVNGQCIVLGPGVTMRRAAIERAGMYDPEIRHAEDLDLWLRFVKTGGRIVYHRRILYHLQARPGSLTSQTIKMNISVLRILEKNEKLFPLSMEEQAALNEARRRLTADVQLERGKQAFFDGDLAAAIRDISAANEFRRSWRLRVLIFLMKTAPGLLHRLARARFPLR
jgi:glycosyltransferase involved in cell wall biosynthesis